MSDEVLNLQTIEDLAPSGHYIALRVGFAFPLEEVNALPAEWVEYYTHNRLMMYDPIIRWVHANTGARRWSEIDIDDPRRVIAQGRNYGLNFGLAVSCFDNNPEGQRSWAMFARHDREYLDAEIDQLSGIVAAMHHDRAPPRNLTEAELEALRFVKEGKRLKQMAYELGVSEGAIKQRLKNAKLKLRAATSAQAVTRASDFGLI